MDTDIQNNDFISFVENTKVKLSKELLSDDDLILLTCESILGSYTFVEKNYGIN